MQLLKGKLFLGKIDTTRIKTDDEGRTYIDLVVIVNEDEVDGRKDGVIQQNTLSGESRIYLSNLYRVR